MTTKVSFHDNENNLKILVEKCLRNLQSNGKKLHKTTSRGHIESFIGVTIATRIFFLLLMNKTYFLLELFQIPSYVLSAIHLSGKKHIVHCIMRFGDLTEAEQANTRSVGNAYILQRLCQQIHFNNSVAFKLKECFCKKMLAGHAHKDCLPDGSWFRHPLSNATWSNYTTCVDIQALQVIIAQHTAHETKYNIYPKLFAELPGGDGSLRDWLHRVLMRPHHLTSHLLLIQVKARKWQEHLLSP
jgi:hypothetical protein